MNSPPAGPPAMEAHAPGASSSKPGTARPHTRGDLPPAPVRGSSLFVRFDRALAWCDALLNRVLPEEGNPLARAGAAANLALIVAVVSGVALLLWYSPSVQFAYASLESIQGRTPGGWVRAVHRYSADLAMLFLVVHAGRTFFARKFAGARWLAWVSGVVMLGLVWFIGWTGYWLVWDQPAQQVAVASMRLLDALPIFGEPLGRLYLADRLVPSLLFFVVFFLHMLLPLGIAIGLALHLARVSRARLLPSWRLSLALFAGLSVAALIVPAPLDAPAQMAVKAEHFTVDAWYLTPLALGLRFQNAGLWIALGGTTLFAVALPWLLGRRPAGAGVAGPGPASTSPAAVAARWKVPFHAVVEQSRCHACTQCAQDCPFDAITMVPRTDGKPFASMAQVDPARCVGCGVCAGSCDSEGIALPWFDTRGEEARMEEKIHSAITLGAPPRVALVCGEIDGGLSHFRASRWNDLLPGYLVHPVPTSSWVQPKFVERLLRRGVQQVLIVRDARHEAWSRDGRRWVAERLLQTRAPKFRPKQAGEGGGAWCVVDFDAADPAALTRAAKAFAEGPTPPVVAPRPRRWLAIPAGAAVIALVTAAALAPSHLRVTNPAPAEPELVVSFKALGAMVEPAPYDPAQDADKPVHMRGRATGKPERSPVRVRITVDGTSEERTFAGKGLSSDGPALGEWRWPLAPGAHAVEIAIATGGDEEPARWHGTIDAQPRRLHVVIYESAAGFRLE